MEGYAPLVLPLVPPLTLRIIGYHVYSFKILKKIDHVKINVEIYKISCGTLVKAEKCVIYTNLSVF